MKKSRKRSGIWMIVLVSLTGCEMVESTNKVVYEDMTPVMEAKVHQYSDTVDYITYTNILGEWSLILPVGSKWELCIQNPKMDYEESCYDGFLIVDAEGELLRNP